MAPIDPEAPVDLHTHTTASDGTCCPRELVERARRRGLAAVAITDHDTVAAVPEAEEAGRALGVEAVAGLEVSAHYRPATPVVGGVLHILGYLIDPGDEALQRALAWVQERRRERNPEMIRRLRDLGIDLSLDEVVAQVGGPTGHAGPPTGMLIGRPHIARALVERGVVSSVNEAFQRYLRQGGPAYVEKEKLAPRAAIGVIRGAGGIAVLAHPAQLGLDADSLEQEVLALVADGIEGIECYYPSHTPQQAAHYVELARRFGLAVTGGSDYHGDAKPGGLAEIGPTTVPYRLLEALRVRAATRR